MFVSNILHCVDTYEWPKYNKLYFTYWEHVYTSFSHQLGICNSSYFFCFGGFTFCIIRFVRPFVLQKSTVKSRPTIKSLLEYRLEIPKVSHSNWVLESSWTSTLSAFCVKEASTQVVLSCSEGSQLMWCFLSRSSTCFVGARDSPCIAVGHQW